MAEPWLLGKKDWFFNYKTTNNAGVGKFNPFRAGTVFSRRNPTSVDVRFWRLKTVPALEEFKKFQSP